MIVEGTIRYEGSNEPIILPPSSCAKISITDASIADAPSTEIASKTLEMSGVDLMRGFIYSLEVCFLDAWFHLFSIVF